VVITAAMVSTNDLAHKQAECARRCARHPSHDAECNSFNYHVASHTCSLLHVKEGDAGTVFLAHTVAPAFKYSALISSEYHYFELRTYDQAPRDPAVQADQLLCTHLAAQNAKWGTVAKCASHPAWKSGCHTDAKCEFLPYVDEWNIAGWALGGQPHSLSYAKWNRLDDKKLTTSGSWTEAYDVAAVPTLHECALLAEGVRGIKSFNYNAGAKTCQLLSGVELGTGTTLAADVGTTFVEFFVPYEAPADHNHGACTHKPGTKSVNNFKVSASDAISTCAAIGSQGACATAADCEWKPTVSGWQGTLDTTAPLPSKWT
jgi:hypothetical protein